MGRIVFNEFIQVAGIIDRQECDLLIESGINYLGFPLRLPVNKEDLSEEEAGKIIKSLVPPHYGIVISYPSTADESIELCDNLGSQIIQLHGAIEIDELHKLKLLRPNLTIIKSLVISENNADNLIDQLSRMDKYVDAYITDTFDPQSGASGATGKTHDWNISKKIITASQKPVILAGGLNPSNVYEAILSVKPAGVDVHTGIENSSGRKDRSLLLKFISEAKNAFSELKNENKRI
jgi:phosphoribosylanthranilate isomerase